MISRCECTWKADSHCYQTDSIVLLVNCLLISENYVLQSVYSQESDNSYNNGCEKGYARDPDGNCVRVSGGGGEPCEKGYARDPDGNCVRVSGGSTPGGEPGTCISDHKHHHNDNANCYNSGPPPSCIHTYKHHYKGDRNCSNNPDKHPRIHQDKHPRIHQDKHPRIHPINPPPAGPPEPEPPVNPPIEFSYPPVFILVIVAAVGAISISLAWYVHKRSIKPQVEVITKGGIEK